MDGCVVFLRLMEVFLSQEILDDIKFLGLFKRYMTNKTMSNTKRDKIEKKYHHNVTIKLYKNHHYMAFGHHKNP